MTDRNTVEDDLETLNDYLSKKHSHVQAAQERKSVRQILGHEPTPLSAKMFEDTADLFENDAEKKQVMANIQNLFKNNKKEARACYCLYGMKPEVFETSLSNPRRKRGADTEDESFSI